MSSFIRQLTRAARDGGAEPAPVGDAAGLVASARHMVIVGGTRPDWHDRRADDWSQHVEMLGTAACSHDITWLTLRPYAEGDEDVALDGWQQQVEAGDSACTVIVDPTGDGRRRFAEAMRQLPAGAPVTETEVASVLYAPAETEPDVVLVLGRDDRLPPSLVWELAYAELVFVDIAWSDLTADHVHEAVAEYTTRNRRFGGVDAGTG